MAFAAGSCRQLEKLHCLIDGSSRSPSSFPHVSPYELTVIISGLSSVPFAPSAHFPPKINYLKKITLISREIHAKREMPPYLVLC